MNLRPLCTAIVCPTISGTTVDRRDQVLMTFLSPPRFITSIFSRSGTSTKGPFFSDLLMCYPNNLSFVVCGSWLVAISGSDYEPRTPDHELLLSPRDDEAIGA